MRRGKTVYIERCPKRATWIYGKFPSGRCDEHKDWFDRIVMAARESIRKLFPACG